MGLDLEYLLVGCDTKSIVDFSGGGGLLTERGAVGVVAVLQEGCIFQEDFSVSCSVGYRRSDVTLGDSLELKRLKF